MIKEGGYVFWMMKKMVELCGAEALADSCRLCHMSKKQTLAVLRESESLVKGFGVF